MSTPDNRQSSNTPRDLILRTYTVEGMTCDHCKMSVTEEVSEVPGVDGIEVDVATGLLTVAGSASEGDVKKAVAEAGYKVVP